MKFLRDRFYKSLIILSVVGMISSCNHETGPAKSGDVSQSFKWESRYACIDGNLFALYFGSLKIIGLGEGEKFKVFFKDTLYSEALAGASGTESVEFEMSQLYHIPDVKIIYRNDTLRLSSHDSLPAGLHPNPLPVRITILAEKNKNDSITGLYKGVSLLVSDTSYTRIRCRSNIEEGWVIVPDTMKYNATSFRIAFLADAHGNAYRITAGYLDSDSLARVLFNYEANLGIKSGTPILGRNELNFYSHIPNLPAAITFYLGIGRYTIRIEKEPE